MPDVDQMTDAELGLAVAKEVMGCRVVRCRKGRYKLVVPGSYDRIDFVTAKGPWSACPKYPTDISAAWEVVEKVRSDDNGIADERLVVHLEDGNQNGWCCSIWTTVDTHKLSLVYNHSAPRAICEAALKAVRAEKEVSDSG